MTQAMCTSFKQELLQGGVHAFKASGGSAFKFALFTASATLDASTTAYSTTNEVTSTNYTAGGFPLTNVDPSISGTTALTTFASNPTWTNVTFNTTQGLIYNSTASNKSVAVLDFGGVQSVTSGMFVVNLPPATAATALLRLV